MERSALAGLSWKCFSTEPFLQFQRSMPPVEMAKGRFAIGRKPQISPLRFAPVEMTKGRAALPLSVVAEQSLLFITLGGPKEIQGSVVEGPAVLSAITHTLRRA